MTEPGPVLSEEEVREATGYGFRWEPWSGTGRSPNAWMAEHWRAFVHGPEIRERAVAPGLIDDERGVYLLYRGGLVCYVGESTDVPTRLLQHAKTKRFDAAFAFSVPDAYRLMIECAYIHAIEPPLNAKFNGAGLPALAAELRRLWSGSPC